MDFEEKEINKKDYENDWAKDIKGGGIHIDNAPSGAQGYYCLGCDKEMQAVKFKNPKYQSYFRHHAHNIDKEKTECVVASRNYRERIASSILNRLKYVKVPTLYKYPPKGEEGLPMFLEESKIITASKVMAELTFYEDVEGNIKWGKNPNIDNRYLHIRPDVTFFDKNEKPILFIEFVITHKLTTEKKVKLSRLGIDTVQIIIPKVPEEEIEKAIKSVRKFKWIYNEIEANTEYVSVSKGNSETLLSFDEDQRKLFEESYKCRASEINNLIRDINKCIRSESYKRTEQLFGSELSRVTSNRQGAEQGLEKLEGSNREKALDRNRPEEERVRSEISKIKRRYSDLESRYLKKDRGLEQSFETYYNNQGIRNTVAYNIKKETDNIERLEEERREFARRVEIEERDMGEGISREFSEPTELAENGIEEVRVENESIEEEIQDVFNSAIESIARSIQNLREQEEDIEEAIWEEFRERIEFEESEVSKLAREEKDFEKTVRAEFHRDLKGSPSRFSKGIKTILEAQRKGVYFKDAKRKERSYKAARTFFNQGTWQKG